MDMKDVKAISFMGKQVAQIQDSNGNIIWKSSTITIDLEPHIDNPGDITYDPIEELL